MPSEIGVDGSTGRTCSRACATPAATASSEAKAIATGTTERRRQSAPSESTTPEASAIHAAREQLGKSPATATATGTTATQATPGDAYWTTTRPASTATARKHAYVEGSRKTESTGWNQVLATCAPSAIARGLQTSSRVRY